MEKTLTILNEMEQAGVIGRYAIGGGVGAIFYMEPFLTYDLDVFIKLPASQGSLVILSPLYDYLQGRGYAAELESVSVEGVRVQFLPAYNALVEEALEQARDTVVGQTATRVLRPEHLLAIMLQTGRDKDRQRLVSFVEEASFDPVFLAKILEQHGLSERWRQWNAPK